MGKGELTKQAVLEQATDIAARLGLAGLTIGSLASTVSISKSGLFGHFKSKEALQLQVLQHARDHFVAHVIHPALAAPRGEPRVRALFDNWVRVSRESSPGCLFVSAAAEFDDQPGSVRDQVVRDNRDFMESLAQVFRTGVGEGHFSADADPDQFAHDLHGVMLAFFHAHRLMQDPAAEARTRRAFEALLSQARPA